ncbi:MAG: hypothetical protein FJ191_14240 [Gammaproteobacteria bacterium]|nr:hypothetical protein [Gammaproteobacteria bacterium]
MPSDPRITQALAALAQPIAEFRAAVQGALVQAEGFVAAQQADAATQAARASLELGVFAAGRVDPAKFAAMFPAVAKADKASLAVLNKAIKILRDVADKGDKVCVAEVTDGRKLGATIDTALAAVGQAFGAIIITELVRGGRYKTAEHEKLLDPTEFRAWNNAERRFAPPLVVEVDGADLHAGALLDFADGREKIVLVVRGAAPPAALVRCVTPGTFVLQTVDGTGLDKMALYEGPAIAAFLPEGAATFMHDPHAGKEPWQRLTVPFLPAGPFKGAGGFSAWQMEQDVKMLADLARTPFAVPETAGGKGAPALGADQAAARIAAWLLDSAGLKGTA